MKLRGFGALGFELYGCVSRAVGLYRVTLGNIWSCRVGYIGGYVGLYRVIRLGV